MELSQETMAIVRRHQLYQATLTLKEILKWTPEKIEAEKRYLTRCKK